MPAQTEPEDRAVRMARFAPLGWLRMGIIGCLGGDLRLLPQYLPTPEPDADLFALYRAFVQQMIELLHGHGDMYSNLATARLLAGDITAAEDILNNLRADRFKLDHGAGYCIVIASEAL